MVAYITGIGWVTSRNSGRLKDLDSFAMTSEPLPDIPLAELGPAARRMDAYSRLGMGGILHALRDAGLAEWSAPRNFGIIAATEYACLGTDVAYFNTAAATGTGASPALFSYTLANTFLGEAAIYFGLTGPTFVINGNPLLGAGVLEMALDTIFSSETDTMLCGVVNPPAPKALPEAPPLPLGALFFVVEHRRPAERLSYGSIRFNAKGRIELDGTEIGDLSELVRRCLKTYRDF
jgi:3-oxoacyl-[acyl-carrier-protein] synthase II